MSRIIIHTQDRVGYLLDRTPRYKCSHATEIANYYAIHTHFCIISAMSELTAHGPFRNVLPLLPRCVMQRVEGRHDVSRTGLAPSRQVLQPDEDKCGLSSKLRMKAASVKAVGSMQVCNSQAQGLRWMPGQSDDMGLGA